MSKKLVTIIIFAIIFGTVIFSIIQNSKDNKSSSTSTTSSTTTSSTAVIDGEEGTKEIGGTVVKIDSSQAVVDGSYIYEIDASTNRTIKVFVPTETSTCDLKATDISDDIKVGTNVVAKGIVMKDGSLDICAKGTFLKKLKWAAPSN